VLDDRLEGKDLEWALEHLKGCDACRDRLEEFREIVVRVERLPSAPIAPAVLRDAYTWAIPEEMRTDPELAFGALASAAAPVAAPAAPRPPSTRFELPYWERPATPEPPPPTLSRSAVQERPAPPPPPPAPVLPLGDSLATPVHAVTVDSRQPGPPPARESVVDEEAAITADARHEARVSTMTRLAVGLVAAACVLLAGILYADHGLLTAFRGRAASPSHTPSASVKTSPAASVAPSPAPSPTPAASIAPAAAVIASLGDGAVGERVWRLRVGTAVPAFTRLVFDMQGPGLPAMTVTQPDTLHLVVTFKNATGPGLATGGIHTVRVAGVEPAVQQGNDLVITVDLARTVQPKVFTLTGPARLVLDLY